MSMDERNKREREVLSLYTDALLNEYGFSAERIRERIVCMDKCSAAKTISNQRIIQRDDIIKTFVGSQREGTGLDGINDTDVLQIYTSVRCVEEDITLNVDNNLVVFQLDGERCPPGHFFLELYNPSCQSRQLDELSHALVKVNSKTFLSSEKFMNKIDDVFASSTGCIGRSTHYMNRKGPSIPKYTEDLVFKWVVKYLNITMTREIDFVRGFPCHCLSVLKRWKDRVRQYEWPSKEELYIVAKLPACVVPVGEKESEQEHLQWRLCFTLAEIHLIKSMNNTQTKVHVLLKLIAKHYLNPECEDITSYVVKNVILWLAEETPLEKFQPRYLLDRLTDALIYLRESIQQKELYNYMIPEKNLFKGKLLSYSAEALVNKLNHVIESLQTYSRMVMSDVNTIPETTQRIMLQQFYGNVFDRYQCCAVSGLTVNQLATLFKTLFYIQNGLWFRVYYCSQILRYSLFKLGVQVFTDPLSIQHKDIIGNQADVMDNLHHTVWQTNVTKAKPSIDTSGSENDLNCKSTASQETLSSKLSEDYSLEQNSHEPLIGGKLGDEQRMEHKDMSNTAHHCQTNRHEKQIKQGKNGNQGKQRHKRQRSVSKKKQISTRKCKNHPPEVILTILNNDRFIKEFLVNLMFPLLIYFRTDILQSLYMDDLTYEAIYDKSLFLLFMVYLVFILWKVWKYFSADERNIKVKVTKELKRFVEKQFRLGYESVMLNIADHTLVYQRKYNRNCAVGC